MGIEPDEDSWLFQADRAFKDVAQRLLIENPDLPLDEIESKLSASVEKYSKEFLERLKLNERSHLAMVARDDREFVKKNTRRWKAAFDALEALWQICAEVGSEFNRFYRPQAAADEDYKFEALTHLHARGLLVAREAIALMRQGYAEGALARWRTLHELTTTATFLEAKEQQISLRYLASFNFQAYKAALDYNENVGGDTSGSFTKEDIDFLRREVDRLTVALGGKLVGEYDWARPCFPNYSTKRRVTFRDIETATDLKWSRPYYQWACQHNHAGHRPHDKGLGMVEAKQAVMLIGPSDGGMVDPLQLVAISLERISRVLLSLRLTIDMSVYIVAINYYAGRVAPIAIEAERKKSGKRIS